MTYILVDRVWSIDHTTAMTDFDIPRYFIGDVADAAGVDTVTLQNWIKRGALEFGEHDREGKGHGSRHLFTFRTALRVATTAELVRNGVTPQRAWGFAGRASIVDGKAAPRGYVTIDGQRVKVGPREGRRYMGIFGDGQSIHEYYGGNVTTLDEIFEGSAENDEPVPFASVIIIALTKIEERVRAKLAARM